MNFHGLNAGDNCGSTSISSTMLAFSDEELSTIAGPVVHWPKMQQFNPADLPCPPQSVMVNQPSKDVLLYFTNIHIYSIKIGTHHCQAYHIVLSSLSLTRLGRKYPFSNTVTHSGSAYSIPLER